MVDRIGKGGSVPPPPIEGKDTKKPEAASEASRPFEVRGEKAEAARAQAPDAIAHAASAHLEKLRTGQIDLPTYLDLKVKDATAHLHGVRPAELDAIRKMLKEQLATDPALADLVQRATGATPALPSDE